MFANFDYAVITPSNDHKMIVRSEDTAFLSKHLRAYGGSGDYQGNRVGRLIRNLTFSGKGLVKVPGNPESIIFDNEDNAIFVIVLSGPFIVLLVRVCVDAIPAIVSVVAGNVSVTFPLKAE